MRVLSDALVTPLIVAGFARMGALSARHDDPASASRPFDVERVSMSRSTVTFRFLYRWRTKRWKRLWDLSFFGGSIVAAFAQGVALGALVQGIEVENRAYAGGNWDWLTAFSVLTGIALVVGLALVVPMVVATGHGRSLLTPSQAAVGSASI
jgi:hypothetical protein